MKPGSLRYSGTSGKSKSRRKPADHMFAMLVLCTYRFSQSTNVRTFSFLEIFTFIGTSFRVNDKMKIKLKASEACVVLGTKDHQIDQRKLCFFITELHKQNDHSPKIILLRLQQDPSPQEFDSNLESQSLVELHFQCSK